MNSRIMEAIDTLEERIEGIKWLITAPFSLKRNDISDTISLIRKSAGVLGKSPLKGTAFENKTRREWKNNSLKRAS